MLTFFVVFVLILYFFYYHLFQKRRGLPPGPAPLPILGNLLSIGKKNQHLQTLRWAKKYGPVYTIWIGNQPNVVITDYQLMKEALVKQGDVFAGRPYNFLFADFRNGQDYGVIINEGNIWKQQRRFALHVLRDFGIGRQLMEHRIMTEADKLIHNIKNLITEAQGKPISVHTTIELAVANIISVLIMGHTFDGAREPKFREIKESMDAFFRLGSRPEFFLLAQYPWLRHVPILDNFTWNNFVHTKTLFREYVIAEVQEHKEGFDPLSEPSDYTAAFLKEMHTREQTGQSMEGFSETQLIAACMDMWIAGMETTLTTLSWAILFMITNPDVQEECHKEIERLLEKENRRVITMADKTQLQFLSATVTEIQRCANLIPLIVQHQTLRDSTVGGFHIPAETVILPQIAAVMSDEANFPSPEKFNPRRYLSEEGKKQAEMVIPFALGKRSCLGEALARMELFLLFAALIQNLKFSVPKFGPRPTLEPIEGFTRAPTPYQVEVELRH